jgi:hypothetical protein
MANNNIHINVTTNADSVGKDFGILGSSITSAMKQTNALKKAFDFLDKAANSGKISLQKYSRLVEELDREEKSLYSSLGKTTSALQSQGSAATANATRMSGAAVAAEKLADRQRMAGKSTNRFGMYAQQVGYQVGDFAVQVQSGQNALMAFGQQGTQLAGLLPGLTGAVLGIGLAIGTAVGRTVLDAKKLQIDFKAVIEELKKPLQSIAPIVNGITAAFKAVGSVAISVASTLANNLDRIVAYATAIGVKLVAGLVLAKVNTIRLTVANMGLAASFRAVRAALASTGIGLIPIVIAEVILQVAKFIGYLRAMAKELAGWGNLFTLLKDAAKETFDKIILLVQRTAAMSKASFWNIATVALQAMDSLLSKMNSGFVNKFIGMFVGMIKAVAAVIKLLPKIFVAVFKDVVFAVAEGINNAVQKVVDGINNLKTWAGMNPIQFDGVIDTGGLGGGDTAGIFSQGMADISNVYSAAQGVDYVTAAHNSLTKAINDTSKARDSALKDATSLDAAYNRQGQALTTLVNLWNNLPSPDTIDFGNMLTDADADDSGKGSGSGSKDDPIAKLRAEIELNKTLVNVSKDKEEMMRKVAAIQSELAEQGKTFDTETLMLLLKQNEALEKQREVYQQRQDDIQGLRDTMESSMESSFMSIVDGTKSVKDAFRDMARDIIKELYRVLVVKRLVGAISNFKLFADGGAFSGGSQIQAYADGGVVGGPTYFPMAGGKTGLMGEAGPEAIMPLKRGSNGKLGVQMEGSSQGNVVIHQSFNFQANGDDSVKKLIAQAAPQIANMTQKQIMDSRRRGGSMKAAFG